MSHVIVCRWWLCDHCGGKTLSIEGYLVTDRDRGDPSMPAVSDLRFHALHGSNITLLNNGRSAARPSPREEFNNGVVMSSRPLRENEMFEIMIDKVVGRWSGSLECGKSLNPQSSPNTPSAPQTPQTSMLIPSAVRPHSKTSVCLNSSTISPYSKPVLHPFPISS